MVSLDLIGVTKDAKTAGPGKRLEIFTKGCIRGVVNPCKGCFNEETWTFEGAKRTFDVQELSDIIERDAWNRQVTFCGGEPMIQAIALTALAKELKERDPDFHIIMYTAYKLDTLLKYGLSFTWTQKHGDGMRMILEDHSNRVEHNFAEGTKKFLIVSPEDVVELMQYVDLIVDGDYQEDKRLTTDTYMHEGWFIGSSNQRVIDCKFTLKHMDYKNGRMSHLPASEYNRLSQVRKSCKCCGHYLWKVDYQTYCSDLCESRYKKRVAFLREEGLQVEEGVY